MELVTLFQTLDEAVCILLGTHTLNKGMNPPPLCPLTLFTNPSARAGYDTRSIFKRRFTGLSSEFSFS